MTRHGPAYDYLLVVGPGRSGTDFLFRNLQAHPQFDFPEIKEGGYYRSPRRFRAHAGRARPAGRILADVTNLAYRDQALAPGAARLHAQGVRVLLVVLLRDHRERARSMVRFRTSRGHVSAWLGARLEQGVIRDRLTPRQVDDIFGIGVDVLCLEFSALIERPRQVFRCLTDLCGVPELRRVSTQAVNPSVRCRSVVLAVTARLGAALLRSLGFRRLLQRLKDSQVLDRLLFVAANDVDDPVGLTREHERLLQQTHDECLETIHKHAPPLADGVYFRSAGASSGS